jgi:hypothetical protein
MGRLLFFECAPIVWLANIQTFYVNEVRDKDEFI